MTTTVAPPRKKKKQETESLNDLHREAGIFNVSITYLPDILTHETAFVSIRSSDDAKIDSFEVPGSEGSTVFNHPTIYSDKLRLFLGGKPQNKE